MGSAAQVLVVDDDEAVGMVLAGLLRQAGYATERVTTGAAGLAAIESGRVDLVLTDLRMSPMDGMALLAEAKALAPDVPVIMLTAHGSVQTAVEAMKKGAADFLLKPFDRDEVLYCVNKALEAHSRVAAEPASALPSAGVVLGRSPAMREVERLVERAARASSTVLLRGESGSGKEVVARAIHEASPRCEGPFVPVHCAALPEALLESELFGYERGAFTGATHQKPGRVELASGGTLFLDEIGDVSLGVQVKLLRLLQEREYQRLGGTRTVEADVRFLAATHQDLEARVASGEFREDLFYRLNVIPILVPPLRERPEDIAPLAKHFCAERAAENGREALTLSPEATARLEAHAWPGNVRELANFVERLVVFADADVIDAALVERELRRAPMSAPSAVESRVAAEEQTLDARREEAERRAIEEALERTAGNRTKAARLLGVSRRTLYNKLAELGV